MVNRLLSGTLLILMLAAISCASSNNSPLSPALRDQNNSLTGGLTSAGSKALWGMWEVRIDTATWQAMLVPLRGPQYTVDVVTFLQKPTGNPANLSITVTDVTGWLTEGRIGVDVGLRHPFPGLDQYTGFDVLGVFMAPGSVGGKHDEDVWFSNGSDEPILLNSDGYTRWMNPIEFLPDGTIMRFVPGKLGDPNVALFTSTINGYKYFADGLAKDQSVAEFFKDPANVQNRGTFRPGSYNEREYNLKFPMVGDVPQLVFQYAVVASWIEPDKTLSGDPDTLDVPGDFAISANAAESICLSVSDNSTLYYKSGLGGGAVELGLEVYDWGALEPSGNVPSQIHGIGVEVVSPGGYPNVFYKTPAEMVATAGSSLISSVFEVEIYDWKPVSGQDFSLLITVESESPAAFDTGTGVPANDDRLAAYFFHTVPVTSDVPAQINVTSPNGAEFWIVDEHRNITWTTADYSGNVKLEYSKDGFVSDIHEIVAATPDTGVFDWLVPSDPSTTVKVRATLVTLPYIRDTSDNDFTIQYMPDLKLEAVRNTYYPDTVNWRTYIDYIHLDWLDIPTAAQYAVYRSYLFADPYSWVEIGTVTPPVTVYDNVRTGSYAINWDGDYIYEVRARSVAGDPSSEFIATQQALVLMDTNDYNTIDTAKWTWQPSINDGPFDMHYAGFWDADEDAVWLNTFYAWNMDRVVDAWQIAYCDQPLPDLVGQTKAYFDFVFTDGPGYHIPFETGWAPGTMSALPNGSESTYFDFDPAPDSEFELGNSYNASFVKTTFEYYFGEQNGAFTTDNWPNKATRYGIPRLLEDGVDYVGIGVAAHNAAIASTSGYLMLDSIAVVVY
jgi:hypothetical protein